MKIPPAFLHPTLRNGRTIPQNEITAETVEDWTKRDDKVLLLRLTSGQELPSSVKRYLDSSAGRNARLGYKCRNRRPWYVVPDVRVPDFVLSYMSGRSAVLARNLAGVTCTNSVHGVRLRDTALAESFLPQWSSPFLRLSCELEGHALGGGMLKLEPREASRILFPGNGEISIPNNHAFEDAVSTLQHWRHVPTAADAKHRM